MKGVIALDIDGTITSQHHAIPSDVVEYLNMLAEDGWQIIFITGRTFLWGYQVLQFLPFHYHLAVQNGAIILEMPSRKIISKKYLHKEIIPVMEQICRGEATDFVIYCGYEYQDLCYWRPSRFSDTLLRYLQRRTTNLKESWESVSEFNSLDLADFPAVKCFGHYEPSLRIAAKIEQDLGLNVPIIRDPYDENYFLIQATHPMINKGEALKNFIKITGYSGVMIAAGDDNNDRTMLAAAHIKIVMESAPKDMQAQADIIAPPATENGIISGLSQALQLLKNWYR